MGIVNILIALLVFGVVVSIHEFGHFSVAKLNKVTVHEFSIGMGPLLFKKDYKNTQYSFRAIPMGGYVAMEGEDEDSDDPNAFCEKSPLQRMAIVFAGPFMNFVLTIVVFILIFSLSGMPVNKVGSIVENSPASKSDLQIGDEIQEVNSIEISSWQDILTVISQTKGSIDLKVKRDDKILDVNVVPNEKSGKRSIGIYPAYEKSLVPSIPYAFKHTYDMSAQMLDFLKKMFTGKINFDYVSGPIGIVAEMGKSVNSGLSTVAMYIAFISLNLGIMNLLPIPALDGFRFVTAFSELITEKKLDKKMEYVVNAGGMIFLVSLMLIVSYKDFLKIFIK